ncbi:MAG: CsbD family protein [Acidobacteria bacterium]|nr:CsbD family protein [Acidobacteriota bacterium]MBV9478623.1 CsbD family protein [Acidobacteriota bacterium]
MNRNDRTDAEEAVANQASGLGNQIKGRVKQAVGDLAGDHSLHASGTKDRIKGKVQEAYGNLKEKESVLEDNLADLDRKKGI